MNGRKQPAVADDRDPGLPAPESRSRPRVICHMMSSLDGRIVTDDWPISEDARRQYEQVHATYAADGWLVGRVTMERHFAAGTRSEAEIAREHDGPTREDHIAAGVHDSFAVALDPRGRLLWDSADLDGDHLVTILTERVSDAYLASLRERGVSYLLAGGSEVDLAVALEKMSARLGVRTLMLEGGGGINGSMLRAGLIDEISLLVVPVADGRTGTAALFDLDGEGFAPRRLALEAVERRAGDVLWLRYRVVSA
jgi:riboflavin biosynthesis pyrimidine reductase